MRREQEVDEEILMIGLDKEIVIKMIQRAAPEHHYLVKACIGVMATGTFVMRGDGNPCLAR
jgi:hypothetical protein